MSSNNEKSSGDTPKLTDIAVSKVYSAINACPCHMSEYFRFKVKTLRALYSGEELYTKLGALRREVLHKQQNDRDTIARIDSLDDR